MLKSRCWYRARVSSRLFLFVELGLAGSTPDVSLTRFGADLFIELWFCCRGNLLEARAAGELFLAWCCNARPIGQGSASSKPDKLHCEGGRRKEERVRESL